MSEWVMVVVVYTTRPGRGQREGVAGAGTSQTQGPICIPGHSLLRRRISWASASLFKLQRYCSA
ncbi:hypothetical protein E2C01_092281 [Portunus trituberculatus]|uniref:Uncharacterized protein n=1 Tax=Portunus trituberculatus TaxID=210409 RepID=A0A5B7JXC1_PORTR|nr:hypothetical protein [Portunus trituberculatus]